MADRRLHVAASVAVALLALCAVGVWMATPLLAVIAVVLVGAVVVRAAVEAYRHSALARALRRRTRKGRHRGVTVRWGPTGSGAAVAGLWRPEIYCDDRLVEQLRDEELTAVVLHERHHQLRRDPMRLLVLAAVGPFIGWFSAGRRWLTRRRAATEIAADRYAVAQGARPSQLASAILRLADVPAPARASAGFAPADELRIRALLSDFDRSVAPRRGGWRLATTATFAVAAVCLSAVVHHLVAAGGMVGCVLAGC